MRPIAACAKVVVESTRVSQVTPESPGTPRAMVLTVSCALSPATGLSCHRHPRKMLPANLMPASGHQDHTPSPSASSAFVKGAISVHRVPSRIDDVAQRPSSGMDEESYSLVLISEKQKYFSERGWTRHNCKGELICPSGNYAGTFSSSCIISGAVDMICSSSSKNSRACSSRDLAGGSGACITSDIGNSLGTSPRCISFSRAITAFVWRAFFRRLRFRHN
jgi:hypothetical protein